MNRSDIIRQIETEYAARRRENAQDLDARITEALKLNPDIKKHLAILPNYLEKNIGKLLEKPDQTTRIITDARKQIQNSRVKLKTLLKQAGLPIDYLEERYACARCRDTGYEGEDVLSRCSCFKSILLRRIHANNNVLRHNNENFETFDESIFPNEVLGEGPYSQRQLTIAARDICKEYADLLPNSKKSNIALLGTSGLGKTFLLNCISKHALEKEIDLIQLTAYQMLSIMRASHVDEEDGRKKFNDMVNVELLLLDDIGSEPIYKNITIEYMFILLNERIVHKRHTVIATNLTTKDLQDRYGERVTSRILSNDTHIIQLIGKDIRLKGKG